MPLLIDNSVQLLPAEYQDAVLAPDTSQYPNLPSGLVPIVLELGHEANAGPPGLNFLSFQ